MAKIYICRTLLAVQLVFVAVGVSSLGFPKFTSSAVRTLIGRPSIKVLDTSQAVTQTVVGRFGQFVSPIHPLRTLVDKAGNGMSNILGSASRAIGKDMEKPPAVIILYASKLNSYSPQTNVDALKRIIGLAVLNITHYAAEMNAEKPDDLRATPNIKSMAEKLKATGSSEADIDDLVTLLGRNGKKDIDKKMLDDVISVMGDGKHDGPIKEIRSIAKHPSGYHTVKGMTDYKIKNSYPHCVKIISPYLEDIRNSIK